MTERERYKNMQSLYVEALTTGATDIQTGGLVGRIIRGKTSADFLTLTDDPLRRIIMLMGSDGLATLLGKTGHDALVAIGYESGYIRRKVRDGNEFRVVVFPEQIGAELATWDNLILMASDSYSEYPQIGEILQTNLEGLKALPNPSQPGWTMESWRELERQCGFSWDEVDALGPQDPRYMTAERLLLSSRDVIAARAFVYFTLHCRELFGGNGRVYNEKGEPGMLEYIIPNRTLETIPQLAMTTIHVELPEDASNQT